MQRTPAVINIKLGALRNILVILCIQKMFNVAYT